MRLDPHESVDGLAWTTTPEQLQMLLGPPLRRARNGVELNEWDYGEVVYRFQDGGRLEEVTRQAPVLHLGALAVPFGQLAAFVAAHDGQHFRRGGFIVSPRWGLAFDPAEPAWVTALARHCLPQWLALR